MLQEFVIVSFASFIGWQLFTHLRFFPVNARLAPLIVVLISYVFTMMLIPSWVIAFASTGGVAVLNKVTEATSPHYLEFPKWDRKKPGKYRKTRMDNDPALAPRPGPGNRIVKL